MSIEAQLSELTAAVKELTEVNKQLLTSLASGLQFTEAASGSTAEAGKRGRKSKKEDEPANDLAKVVDGDPAGTRYWVNEVAKQVYTELPGNPQPEDQNFKINPADVYLAKKAEFAAAQDAAKNAQAAASTAPSATAAPATASAATSAGEAPTWDQTVAALMKLAADPAHGSTAVLTIMKKVDPTATKVPEMKGKGLEAAINAEVQALLNPTGGVDPLFA
ncbi:hypothetical protein [Comamonas sp.]|uniref:hypothetical protein n=1 Tax=Comamonas sp. TaxID=34028 RepID=UPI0028B0F16F|nr:hypothetical protein [Comamonas sp.]